MTIDGYPTIFPWRVYCYCDKLWRRENARKKLSIFLRRWESVMANQHTSYRGETLSPSTSRVRSWAYRRWNSRKLCQNLSGVNSSFRGDALDLHATTTVPTHIKTAVCKSNAEVIWRCSSFNWHIRLICSTEWLKQCRRLQHEKASSRWLHFIWPDYRGINQFFVWICVSHLILCSVRSPKHPQGPGVRRGKLSEVEFSFVRLEPRPHKASYVICKYTFLPNV